MSKMLICPDVSQYQTPLDHTFTRDFVIFRVTFGAHKVDPKFLANANAAKRLYDEGRIDGVLLYTVYTADPVDHQFDAVWRAIGPTIPDWLTGIMIDVESWHGEPYALHGDHSKSINRLYGKHAQRMGSSSAVIAYGNRSDLAELYPGRDHRCKVIVAAYTSELIYKQVRGAIGQQYSDGSHRWSVPKVHGRELPRHSEPFGHCDHNVFPDHPDGRSLVRELRPAQIGNRRAPQHDLPRPHPPRRKTVRTRPSPDPAPASALVSRNGQYAMVVHDDGAIEVRRSHIPAHSHAR